jgi:hypothetical protein
MSVKDVVADAAKKTPLEAEVDRQRVRREATRILDAEERPRADPADLVPKDLATWQAEIDTDPQWRIAGLATTGGSVEIVAYRKTGKTTLYCNLLRAYVDGDDFLGKKVVPLRPSERAAIVDLEMDPRMMKRWLRQQRIENPHKVRYFGLRGRGASFDLRDPELRARWAERLKAESVKVLIVDSLRAILDAQNRNEWTDGSAAINEIKALCDAAGVEELYVVHHMGHGAERGRGDSGIEGAVDAIWKMVLNEKGDEHGPRYFSAFGREVDFPESELAFDKSTGRLTLSGAGGRTQAKTAHARKKVLEFVERAKTPPSLNGIKDGLAGRVSQKAVAAAVGQLVEDGSIVQTPATGRKGGGGHVYELGQQVEM